jgi:outer membrane protein assembly factor BamB
VNDTFLRRLDPSTGNEIWTREFGAPFSDFANGVALSGVRVYVAGQVEGRLSGESGTANIDAFVRTLDSSGADVWTQQFGTTGSVDDVASGVAVDSAGNVYIAGSTRGKLDVNLGLGDAFVRKYDERGNVIWTRQIGTAASDATTGIAVNGTSVYAVGRVDSALPARRSSAAPQMRSSSSSTRAGMSSGAASSVQAPSTRRSPSWPMLPPSTSPAKHKER